MADEIGFRPTVVNPTGLSALIRNLGRDCTPDQFIREFVKNSLEACARTSLPNREVILDYNHGIAQKSGIYKLSFVDNGDGMTLEQMNNLLNSLSASGAQTTETQNYGVGAKIASLTRNHYGVHYESWKDGLGHSILIRYNPKFDIFGIQGYPSEKGEIFYARRLGDEHKPACVKDHGTRVTLFGMHLEQDTMQAPAGMGENHGTWLLNYLNKRFFTLPQNISIQVRVGYDLAKTQPDRHYLAKAKGLKAIADENAVSNGVLELADARAHWWILGEHSAIGGQTGLINQDEVFDIQYDRSNRLPLFGILLGRERVIILIEPNDAVQNTSRTGLKKPDGSELVWDAWQDEFRSKMPQAIADFLDSLLNDSSALNNAKNIYKRLMTLSQLYQLCGYQELKTALRKKQAPSRQTEIHDTETDPIVLAQMTQESKPAKAEAPKELAQEDQTPQEQFFPQVEWTNEAKSAQLLGRAAEYIEVSNVILANQDFKGFQDLITYLCAKFNATPDLTIEITKVVLESAEQALMETVAGVLSLKGRPHWGPGQIAAALSKEALTASVMQRYWTVSHIEQVIMAKLKQ